MAETLKIKDLPLESRPREATGSDMVTTVNYHTSGSL
jgi:hypothetical protein